MTGEQELCGLLVVDKPQGITSHDVVDRIRQLYGLSKVGHSGTLDPAATGLLVLGLGRATRLLSFLQGLPKAYRAQINFGTATSTQDATGEVTATRPCSLTAEQLEAALTKFTGEIEQVPPMVSAVKVGGRRLYKAARIGLEVERKPRRVHVYQFTIERFDPETFTATALIKCSSGTYVRTLAHDLGEKVGCGAHLATLRRTRIGSFAEHEAWHLEDLEDMEEKQRLSLIMPMGKAMRDFPSITVKGADAKAVTHGQPLPLELAPHRDGELPVTSAVRVGQAPAHEVGMTAGVPVAVFDGAGSLIAVYRRSSKSLKPAAVLV
ncbi:MAG: tRNA pseudouridine(55) synthase TruB [Actinomycetota bacterium]|nr:tRNA pseudouridine(55) synthase TruB [Actinomycetota bacterium]